MWLVRMVTQDSASLHCKWGIRKLARQGTLAAMWHFGFAPIGTVFLSTSWGICHLVQPQAWRFKWRISCWLLVWVLEGREDFLESFPFRFNPVSSLSIAFPKYSNPYWSFPTLNFSHATFCRRRRGECICSYLLFCLSMLCNYPQSLVA